MEEEKEIKQQSKIPLILSIIILIIGLGGIGWYFIMQQLNKNGIHNLKDKIIQVEDTPTISDTPDIDTSLRYYLIHNVVVQEKYKDIFLENDDFIGWITIDDTVIDYPVMQTIDDEQFYLRKNFDKEYSISGTIFASAACSYERPSENIILYGHSMNDGSMFQSIKKYADEDYYKEHKYIQFDSLVGNGTYEVIAAFSTESHNKDYEGFDVYKNTNLDHETFTEFTKQCKSFTPYETSDVEYGDELITLSTCAYHTHNGRFVVIAKKISEQKVDLTKDPIEVID